MVLPSFLIRARPIRFFPSGSRRTHFPRHRALSPRPEFHRDVVPSAPLLATSTHIPDQPSPRFPGVSRCLRFARQASRDASLVPRATLAGNADVPSPHPPDAHRVPSVPRKLVTPCTPCASPPATPPRSLRTERRTARCVPSYLRHASCCRPAFRAPGRSPHAGFTPALHLSPDSLRGRDFEVLAFVHIIFPRAVPVLRFSVPSSLPRPPAAVR